MAHIQIRENARALRHKGESIKQIARILKTSKSTVSYWCRDIKLSSKQIRLLVQKQREGGVLGRLRAAEVRRAARISATREEFARGAKAIGFVDNRDIFMLGCALYWGEGYKNGNEECALTNSDPDIIRTFIFWLKRIYSIHSKDLILRVSINLSHIHRIRTVEHYWSRITKIPLSQFTKTSLIKTGTKKIYANHASHFGTLRVKVRKATALRRRIIGSIAEIARQIRHTN